MKAIVTLMIPLLVGIGAFVTLVGSDNVINFMPYLIYDSLKIAIISENNFILFFDFFLSVLISGTSFLIIKRFNNK